MFHDIYSRFARSCKTPKNVRGSEVFNVELCQSKSGKNRSIFENREQRLNNNTQTLRHVNSYEDNGDKNKYINKLGEKYIIKYVSGCDTYRNKIKMLSPFKERTEELK